MAALGSLSSLAMNDRIPIPQSPNDSEAMSVSEIKERAKVVGHVIAQGESAMSLIKTARMLTLAAEECDMSGDLKGALSELIKAATVAQMFVNTAEYKAESKPGMKGMVYKEFQDFALHEGHNWWERVEVLTAKLEELEKSSSLSTNGMDNKSGGSIADRMRPLQDSGLAIAATKQFSRDSPSPLPTPPMSPEASHNRDSQPSPHSSSTSSASVLASPSSASTWKSTIRSGRPIARLPSVGSSYPDRMRSQQNAGLATTKRFSRDGPNRLPTSSMIPEAIQNRDSKPSLPSGSASRANLVSPSSASTWRSNIRSRRPIVRLPSVGPSSQERIRSQQDAGLATTKRFSRDNPNPLPTSPVSPAAIRSRDSKPSLSSAPTSASASNLVSPSSGSTWRSNIRSRRPIVRLPSVGPSSPERMRSQQDAGLATTKGFSRESQNPLPTPPMSPEAIRIRDLKPSLSSVSTPASAPSNLASPSSASTWRSTIRSQRPIVCLPSVRSSSSDRMRSQQDAGLANTKQCSRVSPNPLSTPPLSPEAIQNRDSKSTVSSGSTLASASLNLVSPLSALSWRSTIHSPHVLVPLRSADTQSPTSSPPSSPQTSSSHLTESSQHFPSIDEVHKISQRQGMPSVFTGTSGSARFTTSPTYSKETNRDTCGDAGGSRSFPILPLDLGPRPSSIPTARPFANRPAFPTRSSIIIPSYPLPPTIPRQPPVPRLPRYPPNPSSAVSTSPTAEQHGSLMNNPVFPKMLHELMYQHGYKVLVLDVRNREDFDREHIKANAIVCIEPSVLLGERVTSSTIEESLLASPCHEWALFTNREKFHLVVMYDSSSQAFGLSTSPLSKLVRTIYQPASEKTLKKMPMLLVGGLNAWKRELGNDEMLEGEAGHEDELSWR